MTTEGEKPPNNLVVLPGGSGAPEGDPEMMELFEEASVKLRKDMRGGGIRAFGMVVVLANEDVMAIHQAGQRWHQLVSGLDGVRFKLHPTTDLDRETDHGVQETSNRGYLQVWPSA